MWRLLNKLFGWDYVLVKTSGRLEVCRVIETASGPSALLYDIPRPMLPRGKFVDGDDYCYEWKPLTEGHEGWLRHANSP